MKTKFFRNGDSDADAGGVRILTTHRPWLAALAILAVLASMIGGTLVTSSPARADVPPVPVAAAFDAPTCAGTSGNPSVDADGGPVTNLLSVFGARLTGYNAGNPVILYNNSGRSGWTASGSQYAANPLCMVRYVADEAGPVSSWSYCTFDRASVCGWTNANGELQRNGVVLPALQPVSPDNRLTADQQKLQAYIIQNDLTVLAGPNGSGGTLATDTIANDDTPTSRTLRQNLVHCIDNPDRSSALTFCAANMSPTTQARILSIVNAAPGTELNATGPGTSVTPGAQGQIHVTTTLSGIPLTVTTTGGTVTLCGGPATLAGNTLLVNNDATLPADITLCATRPDAGDVTVNVTGEPPVIDNVGFVQSGTGTLCQIYSTYRSENQVTDSTDASVTFAAAAEPSIGTVATTDNAADNKVLPLTGGTITDAVSYSDLEPNVCTVDGCESEYVVSGELMFIDNGVATPTGIIADSDAFTVDAGSSSGSIPVVFTVTAGQAAQYAGGTLVVYETLYKWIYTFGVPVRELVTEHKDAIDAAQTVTVAPVPAPSIGTTLVDSADGDHALPYDGGVVTDTIAYENLTPGVQYTIQGELVLAPGATSTGITGSVTFTPTAANGTVTVDFTVPAGHAGQVLVAYESLYVATDLTSPIATHQDITDTNQTVTVAPAPSIGTTLVDSADGDHALPYDGGTVTDTIAYENLTPGVQYTIQGELVLAPGATSTGITGSVTFTPTAANGTVTVDFTVPAGHAGQVLVAYETLYVATDLTSPIATHQDITDTAQTVTVAPAPSIGTTLVDSADGDHALPYDGGVVTDTIAYENLTPGVEYTIQGELVLAPGATSTGITGSVTFTPTEANGTVTVDFTVPAGHAGQVLVAYETLYVATDLTSPIATHQDITDTNQTVTVSAAPTSSPTATPTPTATSTPAVAAGPSALPNTGLGLEPAPFIGAAALLALGAFLLLSRRRKSLSD